MNQRGTVPVRGAGKFASDTGMRQSGSMWGGGRAERRVRGYGLQVAASRMLARRGGEEIAIGTDTLGGCTRRGQGAQPRSPWADESAARTAISPAPAAPRPSGASTSPHVARHRPDAGRSRRRRPTSRFHSREFIPNPAIHDHIGGRRAVEGAFAHPECPAKPFQGRNSKLFAPDFISRRGFGPRLLALPQCFTTAAPSSAASPTAALC
jgi:hypothetical protein